MDPRRTRICTKPRRVQELTNPRRTLRTTKMLIPRRERRYTNARRDPRRTRRGTKFFVLLGCGLLLAACASTKPVPKRSEIAPKPDLVFEERVYDFGIAGPEAEITHTFKFTNVGSSPLSISNVSASCGSAAALSSKRDIPPGGSGEILTTFETRRYEGKQETTIAVRSNDPDEPEIDLTVKGMVRRDVAVVPQGVNFGDVERGKTTADRVRLLQLSDDKLTVKRIEAKESYLTVSTSRFREENSRGINIEITLKPEVPVGSFSEVITLHTNVKRRPRIDVPVWANILAN